MPTANFVSIFTYLWLKWKYRFFGNIVDLEACLKLSFTFAHHQQKVDYLKESGKTCTEDPSYAETRKALLGFDKKLKLYIIFAVIYGIVFINFIDVSISGSTTDGYHFWLVIMYFFPFATLSMLFPRNFQLTVGLGLVVSLMNDVFYGIIVNVMGLHLDLVWYYTRWLIPGNALLFQLNLGFAVIPVSYTHLTLPTKRIV